MINYVAEPEWDAAVRMLTGKRGADVIVETVGEPTWVQSIRALGKGGRLVTCGATGGPIGQTDIRYLFRREQTLIGSNGWTHNELRRVASLAFQGKLRPVIDRILPLERAAEGKSHSNDGRYLGRSSSTLRPRMLPDNLRHLFHAALKLIPSHPAVLQDDVVLTFEELDALQPNGERSE